jgi:hypothetical protein
MGVTSETGTIYPSGTHEVLRYSEVNRKQFSSTEANLYSRQVKKYQSGNQKPYIERGQTTQ